ncbi:hypothetical protein CDD82_2741 [Ophiocordyceps australis]|uniref:Mediator of RNA polymerase II transcription subunit 9 n=1 Tax=Ophiocordyceps australis TaxID=1399860 RepID=A0A2C5YLK3_9HYPO|nr:hypothetical protein CDD82_2741 [Ophiocordyceps australis]
MAAPPNPHALPESLSPDHLDVLSTLYSVLAKLRAGIQASTDLAPGAEAGAAQGTATGATPSASGSNAQHLSFKDIPGATDRLKHNLQNARVQLGSLPDMAKSKAQHQEEIKTVQARIDRQRALLQRLRDDGVGFGKDDGTVSHVQQET